MALCASLSAVRFQTMLFLFTVQSEETFHINIFLCVCLDFLWHFYQPSASYFGKLFFRESQDFTNYNT